MEIAPLITIITVTYNAEDVIGKTLASLKEQTFKDFEHLVIDGKSSDNTLELIKSEGLPNSTLVSERDKGLYDAMNKGLRLAKGKYVLFLNAGDAFHSPLTLEHYADKAREFQDIIYGDTIIVDALGNKLSPRHLNVPEKLTKNSFADGMLICHQAFMVRKDLSPEYDLAYRFSADYDWTVKCIANADPLKCCNLKEITINYLHDGLTDKNKWKSLKERLIIMTRHYGLTKTLYKHFLFVFRALKRGKL